MIILAHESNIVAAPGIAPFEPTARILDSNFDPDAKQHFVLTVCRQNDLWLHSREEKHKPPRARFDTSLTCEENVGFDFNVT